VHGVEDDILGDRGVLDFRSELVDAVTVVHGVDDDILGDSGVVFSELGDAVTVVHGVEDAILDDKGVETEIMDEEDFSGLWIAELELIPFDIMVVVQGVLDACAELEVPEQVLQHVAQLLIL